MSAIHPPRELFERFAQGELSAEDRRSVVEHLIAGCRHCRDLAERYWPSSVSASPAPALKLGGGILARLREREARAERERDEAEELLEGVLKESPARRHIQVVNRRRYHTYAFCRRLQDQSITRIFADPHDALALAELSLAIAELVPVADATPALIADLKARSWARVANVRRVLGDFPGAETGLGEARMWLAQGTADPVEEAELLEFDGVLRLAQRRFGEAEAKLQRAIHLHRRIGDRHAEGRAVAMVAVLKNIAGDPQESIRLLHDALALLDAVRDPRLVVNAHHNLAVALANIGEAEESLKEIASVRSLYDPVKDRVSLLRLRQLEARARHSLRESEAAIQVYESVLKEFAELEMPLEVAYASLELAVVHLDLGALDAAQRLATETLAICRALGIEREVLGALLVIEEAAQRKALTHELLNEVRTYLQQARQNPGLKFRG